MKKPPVLVRDQLRITSMLLGLPEPFVRQVTQRMKSDGRLPATRPVASEVTPQSLARLVLGLCAPIPSKATETETNLGALPRVTGDGAETVATELEALIAEAAGLTDGEVDFWSGDLLIAVTNQVAHFAVVKFDGSSVSRTYRSASHNDEHFVRYMRLPLQTLRMLSLELIGD